MMQMLPDRNVWVAERMKWAQIRMPERLASNIEAVKRARGILKEGGIA